jgi:hypothetical protein
MVNVPQSGYDERMACVAEASSRRRLHEQVPVQDGGGHSQQQRRQPRAPRAVKGILLLYCPHTLLHCLVFVPMRPTFLPIAKNL